MEIEKSIRQGNVLFTRLKFAEWRSALDQIRVICFNLCLTSLLKYNLLRFIHELDKRNKRDLEKSSLQSKSS